MTKDVPYIKTLKRGNIMPQSYEAQINFAMVRRFFLGYALSNKPILWALLLLSILQGVVVGFGIWYLKYAIDLYLDKEKVASLIYAILIVTLVKSILEFLYKWALNYYQLYIRDILIEQSFSDLLNNAFYLHIKIRNSRKYGWVLEDTEKFIESMFALFQLYLRQPIQIISVFIAVFVINWKLAIFGLLAVPAIIPILLFMRRKTLKYIKQRRALLGLLEEKVAESVYAIRIVKTFGLEERETRQLREILKKQRQVFSRNAFYNGLMGPSTELVGVIGLLFIILIGMQNIAANSFSAGTFLAFMMAFLNVYRPFKEISTGIFRYQLALDTGRRLLGLRNNVNKKGRNNKQIQVSQINEINFKNVWFSYEKLGETLQDTAINNDTNWILQDVNVTLKPGETVLLAGMSGAGKSTFCDLLMGLFELQQGSILINGHSVNNIAKSSLRKLFAMCSQETIVFDASLFDNIRAADTSADAKAVMNAARLAQIPEHLLEKMHKPIGDRGVSLSGGERQRLALARAILLKPHLLIIDEAMNNIDPDTESRIWTNMKQFMPNTIFIVVSHRWLDLSQYNRLLIMGQGRILDEIYIDDTLTTRQMFEKYRQALGLTN